MTKNRGTSSSSFLGLWIRRTAFGLRLFGLFSLELLVANLEQVRLVLGRPSEIREAERNGDMQRVEELIQARNELVRELHNP